LHDLFISLGESEQHVNYKIALSRNIYMRAIMITIRFECILHRALYFREYCVVQVQWSNKGERGKGSCK